MEFCELGDLFHSLGKGLIKVDDIRLKISLDIALGMLFLHSQTPPIAHRDLRSPNVLLVSLDHKSNICAKLTDFGLTTAVAERSKKALPTWQWMVM